MLELRDRLSAGLAGRRRNAAASAPAPSLRDDVRVGLDQPGLPATDGREGGGGRAGGYMEPADGAFEHALRQALRQRSLGERSCTPVTSDERLVSAARADDEPQYEAGPAAAARSTIHRPGSRPREPARRRSPPRASAAKRSITCCSTGRRASARRRSPTSSPTSCGAAAARRPGRCSRSRATWPAILTQPQGARRAVHRRDPPHVAGDRGDPLSGDGGLRARPRDRPGPQRPVGEGAAASRSRWSAPPRGPAC